MQMLFIFYSMVKLLSVKKCIQLYTSMVIKFIARNWLIYMYVVRVTVNGLMMYDTLLCLATCSGLMVWFLVTKERYHVRLQVSLVYTNSLVKFMSLCSMLIAVMYFSTKTLGTQISDSFSFWHSMCMYSSSRLFVSLRGKLFFGKILNNVGKSFPKNSYSLINR